MTTLVQKLDNANHQRLIWKTGSAQVDTTHKQLTSLSTAAVTTT